MDVCSVHHNNTFLRFSVSLLGYGFYGDLLAESETKRWLGPARYDLAGTGWGIRPLGPSLKGSVGWRHGRT